MVVTWLRTAADSLDFIQKALERRNPRTANNMCHRIIEKTALLQNNPKLFSPDPQYNGYYSFIVKQTYKVIYYINYDTAEVLICDVWDCRQEPDRFRRRLKRKATF